MSLIIGNQSILDILDEAKRLAVADNDIRHAAVVLAQHSGKIHLLRQGEVALEKVAKQGLEALVKQTTESIDNAAYPERNPELDASYACYNLATGPIAYDMLVWLAYAEMYRVRNGGAAPLKVGFWLGKDPSLVMGDGKRMQWLEHVYRPALALVGAVEDPAAVRGWHIDRYTIGMVTEQVRQFDAVPPVFSYALPAERYEPGGLTWVGDGEPPGVPRYRYEPGAVTITLREAEHWPHRNSNYAAWLRFAQDLRWRGENVIIIRDTARAMEPIGDFETDPLASLDLQMRMARYQSAKANLFVSNGPVTLAVFSERPWLQFVPIESEESGYAANRPSFWQKANGIAVGEQYPWSTPAQRIVWEADTYPALCRAWEQLEEHL